MAQSVVNRGGKINRRFLQINADNEIFTAETQRTQRMSCFVCRETATNKNIALFGGEEEFNRRPTQNNADEALSVERKASLRILDH